MGTPTDSSRTDTRPDVLPDSALEAALAGLAGDLVEGAQTVPSPGEAPREGAGAVAIAVESDGITAIVTDGETVHLAADGSPLPAESLLRTEVTNHTLFDLASVTKILTTLSAAVLIERGELELDRPLIEHGSLPDPRITARHLLTHTAGLPPTMPLWRIDGGRRARLETVRRARLDAVPGERHAYSCIGFLLLGAAIEQLSGERLPEVTRELVLDPADITGIQWDPPAADTARSAATEYQESPARGLVRGSVHDEAAWSLGGAANAGAFADIHGALALGRLLAGTADGPRISDGLWEQMSTDQLGPDLTIDGRYQQGLGLRIGVEAGDEGGDLVLPSVIGHPGFTGTSVHADRSTGTVAVLLTNRVHPRRHHFTVEAARRRLHSRAFGGSAPEA